MPADTLAGRRDIYLQ